VRSVAAPALVERTLFRFLWEQTGLVMLAHRVKADLIHSPHYTMPLLGRPANVVTLHDATFFSDPLVHSRVKRVFFRFWTRRALTSARVSITPSAATAQALREHVSRIRAEIVVAHLGIDHEVFRVPTRESVAALSATLGLGGQPWVAFLGTLEPRKNVPSLVRALGAIGRKRGAGAPALVLAGASGWDDTLAHIVAANADNLTILTPGYLPLEQLHALLGGSIVTVYPSFGEGFGLPVLEAMASGAPVLTTRRLALPEVGGDAVAYCEPDADSIRVALEELIDDPLRRDELRRRGLERSAMFTWRRTADAHIRAYAAAVGGLS
jgi:glycosyltransferase involved in cell wall biosynthesis